MPLGGPNGFTTAFVPQFDLRGPSLPTAPLDEAVKRFQDQLAQQEASRKQALTLASPFVQGVVGMLMGGPPPGAGAGGPGSLAPGAVRDRAILEGKSVPGIRESAFRTMPQAPPAAGLPAPTTPEQLQFFMQVLPQLVAVQGQRAATERALQTTGLRTDQLDRQAQLFEAGRMSRAAAANAARLEELGLRLRAKSGGKGAGKGPGLKDLAKGLQETRQTVSSLDQAITALSMAADPMLRGELEQRMAERQAAQLLLADYESAYARALQVAGAIPQGVPAPVPVRDRPPAPSALGADWVRER